ncbi:MAG TPA: NADH-ubiquinone/plastoquinone oxidoreductase chain 3 [Acidimicrobiaceae bacterium]|jgi:NADH-quinone oxidoreductase subunit A|nr:NADH-quinone oxidoreductase subunit A [Actinomycetota bacterium]MEC9088592.1 NADH-quinone oxidoreductase subunit A [Actinomycetota bacterium]HAQ43999.1 NADH-ubiquinone/plastoquinone oxidoreductase chain 3 [Acidimicrobiaceae bacterium]|tara:strand:+ start:5600 stop:6076 length:477 start_codon:yes stop_codon:yes gene_type:complete
MEQYLPVLTLGILGVLFVLLSIIASRLLAPERSTIAKRSAYECGITDQAAIPERFPVKFYLVAMLFIMFDIEIVFLYPWAVANDELGLFGLVAMTIFAGIFFLSFVYELAKGGLNWGPGRRIQTPATSPERTTASTIKKVGLEGRLNLATTTDESEAA